MDTEFVRKALGDAGIVGAVLAALGVALFGRENRREGIGALAIALGSGLVTVGLMGGFLRAMDMEFEDLQ